MAHKKLSFYMEIALKIREGCMIRRGRNIRSRRFWAITP
ncbi:hypothetical protein BACCAP_00798 [Pseudoflavonifractor capillosus ATCC 29799]|uniref:Uncharacterized protein n=1 Tax=Pseudoflavonifractor capillosus ATCC 29799 TaxID=411467 RepID=A6NRH0_9FIRM|nr:hypothetical protein BACCAP_00798 [Pseudoflavonifractor capillosus ATCC 29799]